jgi:hypothetical protein
MLSYDYTNRLVSSTAEAREWETPGRFVRQFHAPRLTIREMFSVSNCSNACCCSALWKIRFGITVN